MLSKEVAAKNEDEVRQYLSMFVTETGNHKNRLGVSQVEIRSSPNVHKFRHPNHGTER